MPEKPAGKVEHYYPKVQAAAVKLSKKVKIGDKVHIVGHGDDFQEKVTSLQLDHKPIQEGQPGQSIGLWVKDRVHEGDDVLLVMPDEPMPKAAKPKAMPKARKAMAKKPKAKKAKAKKAMPRRKSAKARKAKPSKRPMRKSKGAAHKKR